MIKPHAFTVDDFMVMVQAGLFQDQRVELLDGVIVDMSPADPPHEFAVDQLIERLYEAFLGRVLVRVQNAVNIELPKWLPHPDVALVERKNYARARPKPSDVYLLIEVANTSLALDKGRKREIYAQVGVKEYWIADLDDETWIVHRDPEGDTYRTVFQVPFGQALAPQGFPGDAGVWL